jgi:hypothetical protein
MVNYIEKLVISKVVKKIPNFSTQVEESRLKIILKHNKRMVFFFEFIMK